MLVTALPTTYRRSAAWPAAWHQTASIEPRIEKGGRCPRNPSFSTAWTQRPDPIYYLPSRRRPCRSGRAVKSSTMSISMSFGGRTSGPPMPFSDPAKASTRATCRRSGGVWCSRRTPIPRCARRYASSSNTAVSRPRPAAATTTGNSGATAPIGPESPRRSSSRETAPRPVRSTRTGCPTTSSSSVTAAKSPSRCSTSSTSSTRWGVWFSTRPRSTAGTRPPWSRRRRDACRAPTSCHSSPRRTAATPPPP